MVLIGQLVGPPQLAQRGMNGRGRQTGLPADRLECFGVEQRGGITMSSRLELRCPAEHDNGLLGSHPIRERHQGEFPRYRESRPNPTAAERSAYRG